MVPEISAIDLFNQAYHDFRNHCNSDFFLSENYQQSYNLMIDHILGICVEVYNTPVEAIDTYYRLTEMHDNQIADMPLYLKPRKRDLDKIKKPLSSKIRANIEKNYNPYLSKSENAKNLGITTKTLNSHLKALNIGNIGTKHKVDRRAITVFFDHTKSIKENWLHEQIQKLGIAYNTYRKEVNKLGLKNIVPVEPIEAPEQSEIAKPKQVVAKHPKSVLNEPKTSLEEALNNLQNISQDELAGFCPNLGNLGMTFNKNMSASLAL